MSIDWDKVRAISQNIRKISGSWQVKVEAILKEQATHEKYQLAAIIQVCEQALDEM